MIIKITVYYKMINNVIIAEENLNTVGLIYWYFIVIVKYLHQLNKTFQPGSFTVQVYAL